MIPCRVCCVRFCGVVQKNDWRSAISQILINTVQDLAIECLISDILLFLSEHGPIVETVRMARSTEGYDALIVDKKIPLSLLAPHTHLTLTARSAHLSSFFRTNEFLKNAENPPTGEK
ncbi:hypothetical protein KIN20_009744 [Parelaphostrongylus tenuis]|uniref:Uncharacterized protein n=1 Tax=Parelaphostrongylus tenuis TaxID=148309 RepID=A0AAD5QNK3_PARTN|nr:hypothetical protein KIN20_009744 [Parelaphostrongylus tenuis]